MQIVTAETQIQRRRKKALTDIKKIENTGDQPLFSTYRVVSRTGRDYTVHIRSVDQLINSCTCPDYMTNTISTCKHIEGVLQHMKRTLGKKWNRLAAGELQCIQIFLHRSEYPTVRIAPLPEEMDKNKRFPSILLKYFDIDGEFIGSVTRTLPVLLNEIESLKPEENEQIFIHEDVHHYLENLKHQESVERQKKWFIKQVEEGNRSLDVLKSELYRFQRDGVLHLAFGSRVLLADDMGLGKTVQAIAAISLLHHLRDVQRVLIVCPASLKHQWEREIHRFTNFSTGVIAGSPGIRKEYYRNPAFFSIINYELVRRDHEQMQIMSPDVIILDEAQRIKNWRTQTADAVKRLRSRYAFVLTGTPLENRLDELYSVFQFIDPSVLGPLWRFNQRYFQLEQRKSGTYKVLGYRNLHELRNRIAPYVLRRTRNEVLKDLPPRTDNNYFVEMTPGQERAYNEYREIMARLLAQMRKRPLTPKEHDILLRSLVKMRMICDALALHDKNLSQKDAEKTSPKLRELKLILEDEVLGNNRKAIVFSQWTRMLSLAERAIKPLGIKSVTLSGSVPSNKRGELISRFFEDPECMVFFSSDAGGLGLNLQAASLVINLDLPWNPAVLEQRIARAHRHGQKNAVQVVNLIAKGTIEERMLDTLSAKRDVFQGVFGTDVNVEEISFVDTGQQIMKQLQDMLQAEPVQADILPEPKKQTEKQKEEYKTPPPILSDFTDAILGAFPGRIQLVGYAPQLPGAAKDRQILLVVDRNPDQILPAARQLLKEQYAHIPEVPTLHIMEKSGYQILMSILGRSDSTLFEESDTYRSSAINTPTAEELRRKKLKIILNGFEQVERKLKLANVLLSGGFPEEVLRPIREALAWTLSSLISIGTAAAPTGSLPSPRKVQAELVETGILSKTLAGEVARTRTLTAPPEQDEETGPPPSIEAARGMIQSIETLIDLGRETVIKDKV